MTSDKIKAQNDGVSMRRANKTLRAQTKYNMSGGRGI